MSPLQRNFHHYVFGSFGYCLFFLYSQKDLEKFVKLADIPHDTGAARSSLDISGREWSSPSLSLGYVVINCRHFEDGKRRRIDALELLNTVAHECSHAVDSIVEFIGERYPGTEFKAFTIAALVGACVEHMPTRTRRLLGNSLAQ